MALFRPFRSYTTTLEVAFLGLAGLAIVVTGWEATYSATDSLRSATFNRLTNSHRARSRQIEFYFTELWQDLVALSVDESTVSALEQFSAAWPPGPTWNRHHDRFHRTFQRYQSSFGAYDLFLITPAGRVVYTVRKERDLGASLTTGDDEHTPLAAAFHRALAESTPDQAVFEDYAAYAPSGNVPAAFLAAPVFRGDRKIGVLALQVSIDEVNEVITGGGRWRDDGFGETGQVYLVDAHNHLRSAPRHSRGGGSQILETSAGEPVSGAGTAISADGLRLRSWGPLILPGVQWTVIAEIDAAEALAPVRDLQLRIAGFGLLIAAVIFVAARRLARGVTAPILALAENARRLGDRDFTSRIALARSDEIGALAESFNQMADRLERTTVSKQAVDHILASMLNAVIVAVDGRVTRANPAAEALLGYAPGELPGLPVPFHNGPTGRAAVEAELTHKDGHKVPVLLAAARLDPEDGVVYVAQDITELRRLAGRLIAAQEEERSRIARELHDDFSQRLAVAAIVASQLHQEDLRRQIAEIATDLHALSRGIHPSMLDDLGLEAAAAAECRASFERGGPPVDFQVEGDIDDLTPAAALALYRILQECLRNVARHAAAQQVTVRLRGQDASVDLEITDDGAGFDPAAPARRPGLGLAAMDERARLLGGRFELETGPGRGVRIHASIPRGAHS